MPVYTTGIVTRSAFKTGDDLIAARRVAYSRVCHVQIAYRVLLAVRPFLGCRGIRFSLDQPELFLMQLRAMLRANAELSNLQVLFPMIGTVGELDEALGLLERAYRELTEEGPDAARRRVGVMLEVPASVHLADILLRRVDFLSIGTNDLTQYMLAVDRNNAQVVSPCDGLHPAVLNAIHHVIETGQRHGKPVSVCGEMAGDPAGALLLLGMGVDSLSMSPALLPQVKLAIRCFTQARARLLADTVLGMSDGFSIHRLSGNSDLALICSRVTRLASVRQRTLFAENGSSAEIGVAGCDGVVGIVLFMGDTTPNLAVVRSPKLCTLAHSRFGEKGTEYYLRPLARNSSWRM